MAVNIEEILKTEGVYVSTTAGVSMYPMLRNRKDTIIISPCTGKLKKYDIPLYRRGDSYILHRIVEVRPDSYVILGDNCVEKEYGIRQEQVIGVLTGCYRGDKEVDLDGTFYKSYVHIWCAAYPIRRMFKKTKAFLRKLLKPAKETVVADRTVQDAGLYLMELIRAALQDEKAAEKPENISWEHIYSLAKENSVESLSAYGVAPLEKKPPQELWKKWENQIQKTMFRILQFDFEREQIFREMDKAGLSYLPLKGVQIAGYYPKPGMRTMADNDILYGFAEKESIAGKEATNCIDAIMKKRGYHLAESNEVEEAYHKKPLFNFEMHKKLMHEMNELYFYYENSWEKAIPLNNGTNEYRFSDEDEYIYFLAHGYKHFSQGGVGIRMLADEYVFLKEKGQQMDRHYIEKELEIIGLKDFERQISQLAKASLGKEHKSLSKEEQELLFFMLKSGTYGNQEHSVENRIQKLTEEKKNAKVSYIIERIFPRKEWYKAYHPLGYKYPVLRPFISVWRIGKGIIVHPKKLYKEWKLLKKK